MIRTRSDHELVISHPPVCCGYLSRFEDAFCNENYNISRSGYLFKFHRILRLPRKVARQDHQILRLPRKMTLRLMSIAYETSFTMRGATSLILQRQQILHLPRKITLLSDVRHISNVIYNARNNRHHPPTSPNAAPATQNCTPKSKKNFPKSVEASIPMRSRFEHDPNPIRP